MLSVPEYFCSKETSASISSKKFVKIQIAPNSSRNLIRIKSVPYSSKELSLKLRSFHIRRRIYQNYDRDTRFSVFASSIHEYTHKFYYIVFCRAIHEGVVHCPKKCRNNVHAVACSSCGRPILRDTFDERSASWVYFCRGVLSGP